MLLLVILVHATLVAQTMQISNSTFSMGFGESSSENETIMSMLGQPFIHSSSNELYRIDSGFLVQLNIPQGTTSVQDAAEKLPDRFDLFQNYPNPFNPTTTIEYQLPVETHISLTVYNLRGQKIRTLVDEKMNPGKHSLIWDAQNDNGQVMGSGVYMVRLQTENFTKNIKLTFLK